VPKLQAKMARKVGKMSTEIQRVESMSIQEWSTDKVDLIKRTICKDATSDELELFMYQCKKTGLDPLARQIYFQKYKNRNTGKETVSIITGIDGYRLVAHRTGNYAGNDPTKFDDENDPTVAFVTVFKLVQGVRCAFHGTARWSQYYPGLGKSPSESSAIDSNNFRGTLWRKMPHVLLEKCAEAQALRRAFPSELTGLYTSEEMEQAEPIQKPIQATAKASPLQFSEVGEQISPNSSRLVTQAQLGRLWAIATARGWKTEDCKFAIGTFFGKESSKELTWGEYEYLVDLIQKHHPADVYSEKTTEADVEIPNPFVEK